MMVLATHVSGSDDTLPRIAALYYGRWELFYLIYEANKSVIGGIDGLRPGMPLAIPLPATKELRHVVQTGDSFEALSLFYYETEHFARLIRKANGGIVIYESVGVELVIPALVTPAELDAASRRTAA
jgi:nucleoid-associated protein YgaU